MKVTWKKEIYTIIIAVLGVISVICGFLSAFATNMNELGTHTVELFGVIVACCGVLFVIKQLENRKIAARIHAGIILVIIVVGGMGFSFLQFSFNGLINEMNIGITYDYSLDFLGVVIYFTIILCIVFCGCLYGRKNILAVLLGMGILATPMFYGKMPSTFCAICFVVFLAGFFSSSGKKRSQSWITTMQMMLATALLCLFIMILIPQSRFTQWKVFGNVRTFLTQSFQKNTGVNENVMTSGGVNGGAVGNVDEIVYSNQTMLSLKTGTTGSIYLNGFTGTVFQNNQWRDLNTSEYQTEQSDYAKMFETFFDQNVNPSLQTAQLFAAMESSTDTCLLLATDMDSYFQKVLRRKFSVFYEGEAKVFSYIPYGNLYSVQKKSSYDGYYLNDKDVITSYAYEIYGNDFDFWKKLSDSYSGENNKLTDYIEWEKQYRAYVYDLDTNISDEYKQMIASASVPVPEYTGGETMHGVLDYAEQVKEYFQENFAYTLAPGRVPEGKNAIAYFMNETQEGYCTYFASAAVMIFRNAGIPCRYVEGYAPFVSETNAVSKEQTTESRSIDTFSVKDTYTKYSVNVTDADAHAWVELYMDGYGWTPVDVTPGYQNRQDASYFPELEDASDINIFQSDAEQESGTGLNQNGLSSSEMLQEGADGSMIGIEGMSDSSQPVEPHLKDHYDSFAEYMKDNTTNRLDMKIVAPIIGRYILRVLRVLALIFLGLAVVAGGFLIPQQIWKRRYQKWFLFDEKQSNEKNRQQILMVYDYVEKLGRFLKCTRKPDESYMEYGKRLEECKVYMEEAGIQCIIQTVLKASFSQNVVTAEEMKVSLDAVHKIQTKSYVELGKIGKLLYKFLWHLG